MKKLMKRLESFTSVQDAVDIQTLSKIFIDEVSITVLEKTILKKSEEFWKERRSKEQDI